MSHDEESDAHLLLQRVVASVSAIPDPIERALECVRLGDDIRDLHAQLAEVRRRSIYEATLRPGATGRSVAVALGVSAKTVSQASAEFRRQDLKLLHELLAAVRQSLPGHPDLQHAEAMMASTNAIGVLAHLVAKLSTPWHLADNIDGGDDDTWWRIHDGFERAGYLSALAGLQRAEQDHSLEQIPVSDEHTPLILRWLCSLFNAMPGISAFGTLEHDDDHTVWTIWWSVRSNDRHVATFSAGPSREGWLVSEWLVWLARDYRISGRRVETRVTAPPPMLNEPGEMLTFSIEADLDGPEAVDPHDFGRSIVKFRDGEGGTLPESGYFKVDWPQEGAR